MSVGLRASAAVAAGVMLLVSSVAMPPAGASPTASGIVQGRAHTLRLRPVLGSVAPPPSRRPKRAARRAGTAALAACNVAHLDALRVVPSVTAADDPAPACVIASPQGASARAGRVLLGPAPITGSEVVGVAVEAAPKRRVALEVRVMGSQAAALDTFAASHFHQKLALTLDGRVVATFDLENADSAFVPLNGVLTVPLDAGVSRAEAAPLRRLMVESESEQLVSLLAQATMTTAARRLVAGVNSKVEDKSPFARDCRVTSEEADSLVFGCFTGTALRVLRVDEPQFAPAMIVSAAHEMLHAAYQSLTKKQRVRIDSLIQTFYTSLNDPDLTALVAEYDKTEPGARLDELHSLLPTEVANLSPPLERYYRRYFSDRARVVAAFASYEAVFKNLEQQYDQLKSQLDGLQSQLTSTRTEIDAAGAQADQLGQQIDSLRSQGRIDESNNLVDTQNGAADRANALVAQYNGLVDQYDSLVDQINAVTENSRELYDAVSAVPAAPEPG